MNQRRSNDQGNDQALMVVQPPRLPMPPEAEGRVTLSKWRALVDAVFPAASSVGGVMLALDYCDARGLDVMKRPVHVVPMWSSKFGRNVDTVWPGIGEMRTTASRTGMWAGTDECVFGPVMRQGFSETKTFNRRNGEPQSTTASCPEFDFPSWAQMTVYKIVAGQRVAFVGPKVRFIETFSGEKGLRVPNVRWRQAPYQMLEKCAEAAALRRAFPEELAGEYTSDEMEGKVYHGAGGESGAAQVVDGEYEVVENGERRDDAPAANASAAGEQPAEDDPTGVWERTWKRSAPDYLRSMENALGSARDMKWLDRAIGYEKERVESLPEREREIADAIVTKNRARLAAMAPPPDVEQKTEQQQQPDVGEEPAYVTNLRARVAEIELVVDLDKLLAAERRSIDALPQSVALLCDCIIEARRDQIGGKRA